jgi:hypothetical protein
MTPFVMLAATAVVVLLAVLGVVVVEALVAAVVVDVVVVVVDVAVVGKALPRRRLVAPHSKCDWGARPTRNRSTL